MWNEGPGRSEGLPAGLLAGIALQTGLLSQLGLLLLANIKYRLQLYINFLGVAVVLSVCL